MITRSSVYYCLIFVIFMALQTESSHAREALSAAEVEAIKEAVWESVEARNSTWVDNDLEAHMAIYHEDFRRWTLHTRKLMTKEEFAELLWGHFKTKEKVNSVDVVREEILVLDGGNVAIAHYLIDEEWEWSGDDGVNDDGISVRKGQVMHGNLRFSDVYVKEDGRWLYIGGHRDKMYLKQK